jgi:hypothetical protein
MLLPLLFLATIGATIPIAPTYLYKTELSLHSDATLYSPLSLLLREIIKRGLLSVGPIIRILFAALFSVFMITMVGLCSLKGIMGM